MAATQLAIGVKKQDQNDLGWHSELNNGMDDLNTRGTLVTAGDPNSVGQPEVHWLGQRCWDSANSDMYIGTTVGAVPATGVWTKVETLIETLANLTSFTTSGAGTVGGLLTASGGIVMPTGQTLEGFTAENFLKDSAGAVMNPFLIKKRLGSILTADAQTGLDRALYLPEKIAIKGPFSGTSPVTTQEITGLRHTEDFSARDTTSKVLFAYFGRAVVSGSGSCRFNHRMELNGVTQGTNYRHFKDPVAGNQQDSMIFNLQLIAGIPASSGRTFSVHTTLDTDIGGSFSDVYSLLIDLGTE